jgi:hypothetical protein
VPTAPTRGRYIGGVPTVVRHDDLKAAIVRACFHDPGSHDVYLASAKHWGFTPLPTQPRTPREDGSQERSGGYVKDNALTAGASRRWLALREGGELRGDASGFAEAGSRNGVGTLQFRPSVSRGLVCETGFAELLGIGTGSSTECRKGVTKALQRLKPR